MAPDYKKWVRPESCDAIDALAFQVERVEFRRTRRRARVGWGSVEHALHALLGIVPWPTDPRDVARIEALLEVLEPNVPADVATFLRGRTPRPAVQSGAQEAA